MVFAAWPVYSPRMSDAKPARKPPRRISATSLENAALHYLERFDSTALNLRRVLERKVRRAATHPDAAVDAEQAAQWIAAVVAKMVRLGYVDDRRTARIKAESLFRRGVAPTMIRRRLALLGAPGDAADEALAALADTADGDLGLAAAVTLARRKRLGPFGKAELRAERRDRDLAALGRAGFDWETARRVVDAARPEDLEADA
ncbi:Regulatory protein RecX [uncultured Alphaproteobacteria bacterium]|uniref:Regulatory protein RecX n=1 Tax=uncultured Alphaproteobacteria bacterium TaxID=91750 RepID=A0A212JTE1_9PROT|nr:Regulatory protein RecX [uncultured Alphaproteobacteria bacterium]